VHWAVLAVGFGFFGFALAAIGGIALSYLMDCYQDVSKSFFFSYATVSSS
jgi:hypothetical protein